MYHGKLIRAAGAGAIVVLSGCESLVDPPDAPATPQFAASPLATADLPIPPTNWHTPDGMFGSYGSLFTRTIGEMPAGKWFVVRVQGSVEVDINPDLPACDPSIEPPYVGRSIGPLGVNTQLAVGLGRPGQVVGIHLDGDSSRAVTGPLFSPTNAEVVAYRHGLIGVRHNCPTGSVPFYAFSGVQTASIELLPQPETKATRTVLSAPDIVRFVARHIPGADYAPLWFFMPNDTLPTPANPGGWPGYNQPCWGQFVCDFPVTQSGRLYIDIPNTVGGRARYGSDVIRVGQTPPSLLTLTCTVTHVPPGGSTTCSAGTAPHGQPLEIHEWFFVLDEPDDPRFTILGVCEPANPCMFQVPGEGRIVVRANVEGIVQVAGVQLSLNEDPVDPSLLWLETDAHDGVVIAGTTVAFTAVVDGAQWLQVQQWTWRPWILPGQSGTCFGTPNPCMRAILENGMMMVRATVDGQLHRATAAIDVGTVCLPNDPIACTGLDDAIQALQTHERALCRIVGETAFQLYHAERILSSDNFVFGGYQFAWPAGPGVLLNSSHFGSHNLLRALVHEVAHSFGAVHAGRAAPGEYTTEEFESQCT